MSGMFPKSGCRVGSGPSSARVAVLRRFCLRSLGIRLSGISKKVLLCVAAKTVIDCRYFRAIIPARAHTWSINVLEDKSAPAHQQRSYDMQRSTATTVTKIWTQIACVLLLLPLLAAVVSAQTFRGNILGTVTD